MDPISIIAIVAATLATATVVYVICLKWDDILAWFRSPSISRVIDPINPAFIIRQSLKSGKYRVVYGVFDIRAEKLIEGKVVETEKLDKTLENQLRGKPLAIYKNVI